MVLVVHIEGVGELLWLAGRADRQLKSQRLLLAHISESDSSPVDVGPQGHRLVLDVLRGTQEL